MEIKKILNKNIGLIIYIFFFVGIAGHLFGQTKNLMLLITPFVLLAAGIVVLYYSFENKLQLIYWVLITYVITFILEVLGVKTGLVFGDYTYGNVLGLKLFEVPVIIGFNWVMVILGCIVLIKKFVNTKVVILFSASLLAVGFDFLLEPVAIKLNYWKWANDIIPLQNYAAWFLISFIFSFLYLYIFKIEIRNKISIHYLFAQILFFLFLGKYALITFKIFRTF